MEILIVIVSTNYILKLCLQYDKSKNYINFPLNLYYNYSYQLSKYSRVNVAITFAQISMASSDISNLG